MIRNNPCRQNNATVESAATKDSATSVVMARGAIASVKVSGTTGVELFDTCGWSAGAEKSPCGPATSACGP
ncbi:hypothetical protein MYFR107205_01485 [Mycolicibacterium frederiksbergense]